MSTSSLAFEFVELLPRELAGDKLYISIPFATAVHRCCCGCGLEVVTPLAPTGWTLLFDGDTVSLSPSIGNWSFRCQSHYWIRHNQVVWANRWSREQIEAARRSDRTAREAYFGRGPGGDAEQNDLVPARYARGSSSFWHKLKAMCRGFRGRAGS